MNKHENSKSSNSVSNNNRTDTDNQERNDNDNNKNNDVNGGDVNGGDVDDNDVDDNGNGGKNDRTISSSIDDDEEARIKQQQGSNLSNFISGLLNHADILIQLQR